MATMTRVHYEIDDELHRQAKAAAALRGISLKQFLEEALRAAIDTQSADASTPSDSQSS